MRQYRLLEISGQYDRYLKEFYSLHKDFDELTYDELFSMLTDDAFAESDFIHRQLRKMGIESRVVFYNSRNLQRKWEGAKKDASFFDILISQIRDFKPDVILISVMCLFSPEKTRMIRECLYPQKIRLVGFHFSTLNDKFKQIAILYDQIYVGNKSYVNLMKGYGLPAYLLRHAFEPGILDKISEQKRMNQICFLGSIAIGEDYHNNRLKMFSELIKKKLPYDFYGEIYGDIQEAYQWGRDNDVPEAVIEEIRENMKPALFGVKYYMAMSQYSICLNLHALCTDSYGAGNIRMFEATGTGTCLLTDSKGENAELFDIDNEIVVYETFEDMVQKAKWLIDNPQKAREIALAGQKRTLKDYAYKNKAEHLNEYIQLLLK